MEPETATKEKEVILSDVLAPILDQMNKNQLALIASLKEEHKASKAVVDGVNGKTVLEHLEDSERNDVKEAKLGENPIARAMDFEMFNIPVVAVAAGGFGAVLVTELIDGFMANLGLPAGVTPQTATPDQLQMNAYIRGGTKIVAAAGIGYFGHKYLGRTGTMVVCGLIAFDAFRDIVPIDTWAKSLSTEITGVITNKGLAQDGSKQQYDKVNQQANSVAKGYYNDLGGNR
jgi:hypothetical protein